MSDLFFLHSNDDPLDEKMIDHCAKLNAMPGITTRFSCEGHPIDEISNGYILFTSTNDKSLKLIVESIPTYLSSGDYSHHLIVQAEIIQGQLVYSIRFEGVDYIHLEKLRKIVIDSILDIPLENYPF